MRGRRRRLAVSLGLAVLALGACGKKGPPVAPEVRAPQPAADLTGAVQESAIVLAWTPPDRRVDNTRLRDLALTRIFRAEDGGDGEPRSAMLVRGRIAGYEEIAAIRPTDPAPAVQRGSRLELTDRRGLAYGRRYTYVVVAGDAQGRVGPPSHRLSLTYAAAPEAPTNLGAVGGERTARLRWDAPTRLLDGSAVTEPLTYEVRRATGEAARAPVSGTEFAPVTTAPLRERALVDSNLENDRTYLYVVRAARIVAGTTIYSGYSPRAAVTPRDATPPTAPTNLVAIPSEATVRLTWNPSPESDVGGYIVYRAAGTGSFERVGATRAQDTTFVDRGVTRGPYRYVVTAQDSAALPNESRRSNEARVTVP